jgi:hypothetical protein
MNSLGEEVTAHSHYRAICHAYPGPDGEIMMDGHPLSPPLESWLRDRRRGVVMDPDDEPVPPCPQCGAPVNVDWLDVTPFPNVRRQWIHGQITCTSNKRHDVTAAYEELTWPTGLTDEDRVWLRRQTRLAKEAS